MSLVKMLTCGLILCTLGFASPGIGLSQDEGPPGFEVVPHPALRPEFSPRPLNIEPLMGIGGFGPYQSWPTPQILPSYQYYYTQYPFNQIPSQLPNFGSVMNDNGDQSIYGTPHNLGASNPVSLGRSLKPIKKQRNKSKNMMNRLMTRPFKRVGSSTNKSYELAAKPMWTSETNPDYNSVEKLQNLIIPTPLEESDPSGERYTENTTGATKKPGMNSEETIRKPEMGIDYQKGNKNSAEGTTHKPGSESSSEADDSGEKSSEKDRSSEESTSESSSEEAAKQVVGKEGKHKGREDNSNATVSNNNQTESGSSDASFDESEDQGWPQMINNTAKGTGGIGNALNVNMNATTPIPTSNYTSDVIDTPVIPDQTSIGSAPNVNMNATTPNPTSNYTSDVIDTPVIPNQTIISSARNINMNLTPPITTSNDIKVNPVIPNQTSITPIIEMAKRLSPSWAELETLIMWVIGQMEKSEIGRRVLSTIPKLFM